MFSGLTNQMSTWMGKKSEEGTAVPDKKVASPVKEAQIDVEKIERHTKGSRKLEVLAGVKTQMSGWFSGGLPGLSRGAHGPEGEVPAAAGTNDGAQVVPNPQAPPEQIKDDDASSATGGADSGPGSLDGGSPMDNKNGPQPFGVVSIKALEGAKTFLYSAVNKASKTVVEAGVKIKKTVEENKLVAELNKEQDNFIASKYTEKGEAVAPWVGAPNEDLLREECLSLSTNQKNFLRPPPEGVDFAWDFEAVQPMAQATLALDPNLENMRFKLVPKVISEEAFWRNYFYRVSVLRQSCELNAMAQQPDKEQELSSTEIEEQLEA